MKAKTTPLKFVSFYVVRSVLEYIPVELKKDFSEDELFASYPIDIDFNHYQGDSLIKVEMNISVNARKKQQGYKIEVVGEGYFKIDSNGLNERQFFNLSYISTTSIMINNIRDVMSHLTAFSHLGAYILPTIDIDYLLKEKAKLAQKDQE